MRQLLSIICIIRSGIVSIILSYYDGIYIDDIDETGPSRPEENA